MKRKGLTLVALGLTCTVLALYSTATVEAQGRPSGGTKVAIVNLQEVFKSYEKYNSLKDRVKAKMGEYEDKIKRKTERLQEMDRQYKQAGDNQKLKEELESQARAIKLEIEELKVKARRDLAQFQDEQLTQIYREVESVVREYASANGIDLVIRYAEEWDQKEYHSPKQVVARLSMPMWPMYYDRNAGVEITVNVAQLLKQKFAGGAGAPAADPNVRPASAKFPE